MVAANASAARSRIRGSRIVSPTRAHAGAFIRISQSCVRSENVMWITEQIKNDLSSMPKPAAAFAVDNLWVVPWIALVTDYLSRLVRTRPEPQKRFCSFHSTIGIGPPSDEADAIASDRSGPPSRRRLPRDRV